MKILLTALPGMGKSTVVEAVITKFPGLKHGIVAREILDDTKKRTGFTSINAAGQSQQFMFLAKEPGKGSIGGEFDVDIAAVDNFVVPELRKGLENSKGLIYIDEIGRAQCKSSAFLKVLREIFKADKAILATIVYEDEPWSMEFKKNKAACLIELTIKNRDALPKILLSAFNNSGSFYSLDKNKQQIVYELLQKLLHSEYFVSASKLFDNAIPYLIEKSVRLKNEDATKAEYQITGKTRTHRLVYQKGKNAFICDCDLSGGKGTYANKPEICSHQLSVLLKNESSELNLYENNSV